MSRDILFQLIGYIILYFHFTLSQYVDNQLCHLKCLCVPDDNLISCDKTNIMTGLPTNIDASFHRLIIQHGNFRDPFIYKKNVSGLSHLTLLKVIYCNLLGVESRVFEGMKNLKYLDLSHNNIRVIQPYTFIGLNLAELHLMENPNIVLLHDSFKGMYAESINLRSNAIKSIEFEAFNGNNFKMLYLYNNSISVLDPRFSSIFSYSDLLIDLTGNPIDCNCDMKWLLEFLKMKSKDPKYYLQMKNINFTCTTGKEMLSLSDNDFLCDKPKIKSIILYFERSFSQLTCVVIGNRFQIPGVSWDYVEDENVKEFRRNPLIRPSKTAEILTTSLSMNISNTPNVMKVFRCKTWLEDHYSDKIFVNIKLPPPAAYRDGKSPIRNKVNGNNSTIVKQHLLFSDFNFLHQKQFTILELIGAIVGTFITTLVILLMLIHILRWWKRSQIRQNSYKHSNVINHQWTLGCDSHNTYSQSANNTDYDVLKVYETHPASICQSSPMNRTGYLDYKTTGHIYTN